MGKMLSGWICDLELFIIVLCATCYGLRGGVLRATCYVLRVTGYEGECCVLRVMCYERAGGSVMCYVLCVTRERESSDSG